MKRLGLFLVFLFTIGIAISAQGYQIGDTTSDFELKNMEGNIVSLSNYPDAKGYIVVFTCDTCSQSQTYKDRIIFINDKYGGQGYPVIAIYSDKLDNYESIQKHVKESDFTFPCLIDNEQKTSSRYGVTKMPEVFLLQKTTTGNIVRYSGTIYDHIGNRANNNYFLDAVDTMLLEDGAVVTPFLLKPADSEIKVEKQQSTPELVD